jgi:hypothetical protein
MIQVILAFLLVASPAGAADAVPADLLETGKALYSQGKEELIIRDFFKDRRDGVYVDLGCWQWETASTTLYLERHLGWSGLAIDALPHLREA